MKVLPIGVIAVMVLVIALAFAGCTSTQTSTPQSGGSSGSQSSGSSASASATGTMVNGADLFQGLSYTWVEYHLYQGSVAEQQSSSINQYVKFTKSGTCTIRSTGSANAGPPGECAGTGIATTETDPNQVSSGAEISCSATGEPVTTPAGTFTATECTVTAKQKTSTVWVDTGKFVVKKEWTNAGILYGMELNAYG